MSSNQPDLLPPRRYWPQWSLRGMFLLTAVCAVVAGVYLAPRIRERAAIDWLRKIEAHVTTETTGPDWLAKLIGEKHLERAVAVDLSGYKLTDDDLRRLEPMRDLHRLNLSGIPLTDRSLDRLPRFEWLEELSLARSNISDAGLARLAKLPSLRRLRLAGSNVTLAAAERTARRYRSLDLDVALGDALYQNTLYFQTTSRGLPLRELIFRSQTATSWKLACARLTNDRQAQVDAYRQQIFWLKKCSAQTGTSGRAMPPLGAQGDSAWLDCATAEVEVGLARTRGDRAAEDQAQARLADAARRLAGAMNAKLESGPIDPFEFERARETATRLLLADAQAAGDTRLEEAILAEAVEQYRKQADMIRQLYKDGVRGGEAERMALAEVDLALSQARLASLQGDMNAERLALKDAASLARSVRESAEASYKAGTITVCDFLAVNGRAGELQLAQARAEGDYQAQRGAKAMGRLFFIHTWRRVSTLDFADLRYEGGAFLRCLYGIDKIERLGPTFYYGPVRALEPPLPDISPRSTSPTADIRASQVALSYLEQHGMSMGASFTVEANREGYDVFVEPIARYDEREQPIYTSSGQCIIVVSNDWKVIHVIDGE